VSELLSLKIESASAHTTVRASGDVDMETAPSLRECLASLAGNVVVDLSEVTFLDSTAMSVLIAEHKSRVASGYSLVITGSSPMALRVFELTGIDHVLNLNGDSPAA
jgi:anti-sigma B factor antagonist